MVAVCSMGRGRGEGCRPEERGEEVCSPEERGEEVWRAEERGEGALWPWDSPQEGDMLDPEPVEPGEVAGACKDLF